LSNPTLDDVLAALEAFKTALAAERTAHVIREQRAEELLDVLSRFRGSGATSADLAAVTKQLQDHAVKLEGIG
jgi:hypothetical protein